MDQGLPRSAMVRKQGAKIPVAGGKVGSVTHGSAKRRQRTRAVPLPQQAVTELVMRRRVIGFERHRLSITRGRQIDSVLDLQGYPQLELGLECVRLPLHRGTKGTLSCWGIA